METLEFSKYETLSLGVDCVLLTTDTAESDNNRMVGHRGVQVLLMKREIEPFNNMWSLPGGLVEPNKGLEETIDEKLLIKTNLDKIHKEQLFTYGDNVNRDPRGRVVTVAYMALAPKDSLADIHSGYYGEVKWFWVKLDNNNDVVITDSETNETIQSLAFDHKEILRDALLRLKGKASYTDVIYNLLPELFTIRELQDVYEEILNKTIYSFRKFVSNNVEETEYYNEIKAHRPAKLYRHLKTNPDNSETRRKPE